MDADSENLPIANIWMNSSNGGAVVRAFHGGWILWYKSPSANKTHQNNTSKDVKDDFSTRTFRLKKTLNSLTQAAVPSSMEDYSAYIRVFFKFYCFFLLDRFHLNLLIPFIGPSRDSAMFPKHCSNKPVELSVKMARPEGAFDREIDKQHIGKLERILNVWHIYLPHFGYS